MPASNDKFGTYATVETSDRNVLTFRVGQPTAWDVAQARWTRLWEPGAIHPGPLAPRVRVRHNRRWYRVRFMEVRKVDRHGRGFGRPDHHAAVPVPYRAVQWGR